MKVFAGALLVTLRVYLGSFAQEQPRQIHSAPCQYRSFSHTETRFWFAEIVPRIIALSFHLLASLMQHLTLSSNESSYSKQCATAE